MSDDLAAFGAHARRMVTATHRPDCERTVHETSMCGHGTCLRPCPGCVTDADRALWKRLADEVDTYRSRS